MFGCEVRIGPLCPSLQAPKENEVAGALLCLFCLEREKGASRCQRQALDALGSELPWKMLSST